MRAEPAVFAPAIGAEARRSVNVSAEIRPTSGKVIAALFNILSSSSLTGGDFLDLFAGSGAVAAEALKRGA